MGVDGLLYPAFCSQRIFLFAEFVQQPRVFGAFGPHHLTSLCLTAGVDFKDSLQDDRRRNVLFYHRLRRKMSHYEIFTSLSTVTHRFGFVAFDGIDYLKALQFHFLQT